jgi:hypothetical protein
MEFDRIFNFSSKGHIFFIRKSFSVPFFLKQLNFSRPFYWSIQFILLNPYSNFNMENTNIALLTSTNYFQWKSPMEDLLRSKGLYRITLGTETAPDEDEKKAKWENKNDQARGLIGMSISPDLRFHLDGKEHTQGKSYRSGERNK